MSRVGKNPIKVPSGVDVKIDGQNISVKGPKGNFERKFPGEVSIKRDADIITIERKNNSKKARSMHGTARALINNMIVGVSTGFEKTLELIGVGYRAQAKGDGFQIQLGYSHPIEIAAPEGITFKVQETKITVMGSDKQKVGQMAAEIRALRKPEPYKGKGVKYSDERIIRKAGKSATK